LRSTSDRCAPIIDRFVINEPVVGLAEMRYQLKLSAARQDGAPPFLERTEPHDMSRSPSHHIIYPLIAAILLMSCGDGFTPPNDKIIIDDNNMMMPAGSAEVAVGFPSGPLLEGGMPVTVTVALKLPPTAPVTIALTSSNEAAGTVSPATLTFDMASWATPQTVALTPVDDEVATGDKPWELRLELTSDDPSFAGKPVVPLKLNTIDNDAAPTIVAVALTATQTTEAGGAATVSVQLSKQPQGDVLIPITLSDPAEADLSANTMTFTPLNWNVAQQVVATGKDDTLKDGDKQYKIVFGPANSADVEFNSIGPAEVVLTSIDGVCGNGTVDGAEACEPDGISECEFGQMDCMVCNNSCQLVPGGVTGFCGDGITQRMQGEECDAPLAPCAYGQMSCTACDAQCKQVAGQVTGFCGDGAVQAGDEECDEADAACPYGQMSCMTCRRCKRVAGQPTGYCGDGVVQAANNEECDPAGPQAPACPEGSLGDPTCAPSCKVVAPCAKPVSTDSGRYYGCAVFDRGAVYCWGDRDGGGGVGIAPTVQPGLTAKAVALGDSHQCFLSPNETVRCVGNNFYGQLGDGTTTNRAALVTVAGLSGVKQLVAGSYFNCALLNSGTVKCWGAGSLGSLGNGSSNPSSSPVDVSNLSGVISIAAGSDHACAVLSSGAVRCWGGGSEGQLGDGFSNDSATPKNVDSLTDAASVHSGMVHTCAVRTSGQVSCWGRNVRGELGDGTTTRRPRPVSVIGLTGVTQLAMSVASTCALLTSGDVRCWGQNTRGQLGDGTTTDRRTPGAAVLDVSAAVHIAGGLDHICAVESSGVTRCWGENRYYQLGQGTTSEVESTPVTLSF
jgi:alpha-tubulin suppressor-like RCC1 family protein